MEELVKTKTLFTIVDKGKKDKILKLYKRHKISYSLLLNGTGTASSSLLNYFGLNEIKKEIIISIIPELLETKILYDLHSKIEIYKPGEGIAFTTKITSASRYLSNQYQYLNLKEEYTMNNEKKYELIIAIVSEGYSSIAMDAAKRVGAFGGTLINGIGLGSKEATNFLGITIEPEKDILLILSEEDNKKKIMEEITKDVGLSKEGKGICFSIPVDNVVGLTEQINFTKK